MAPLSSHLPEVFTRISGYTLTEQLYEGARTAVYRAVSAAQQPVVIKVMRQSHPDFKELVHFRNQYAITKNLPIPGIVRPVSLEPWQNGYALVMEDFEGHSLQQYATDRALSTIEVLGIAVQMADILHGLNQHHVVHKDIKPANILIHPVSKRIQLIDFSIATLLPKEAQDIKNPNVLEGTLAYLAPEQTGRMNRGIDYRTDFYGLGVTLHELLTGQVPFLATDPLELIHCHIAKTAIPAHEVNSAIPPMVSQIVLKLMAKNAEDRYQSALGLKHDLLLCLQGLKDTGEVAEFELGQRDVSDRFLIPEKLYGREREVHSLLEAFERVAQGSAELMLVAGYSGVGKTAVVNEVHKPITRQHGYFIQGKFDQFNRNVPFSAFVQAFRSLINHLLSESDAELRVWKSKILNALGENAQIITGLIPELEQILGAQPTAQEISGTAAQNRFNLVFQKFIQVFTTPEHPLVIFVDDLQWADSASLNLIQILMLNGQSKHLLLLGAYRDNEVSPGHPLMINLDEMRKDGVNIHSLALKPLKTNSLNDLIADTLHAPTQVVTPLTELVMSKTQGNPFFATQFLKRLHQEQLITFDYGTGHWQCDIIKVRDAALTSDVIEFMAQQLQKLSKATQDMLTLAACIGAQFDLETLSIVSEQSLTQVAAVLWPALQEGIILPQSDIYKFYFGESNASLENIPQTTMRYRFLHDRLQQAAYSLIPDGEEQRSHLNIGRHLLKHVGTEEIEQQLFNIVGQLNLGSALITEQTEKQTLLQLNIRAGRKAIMTTAYDTAVHCLKLARELLSTDSWQTQYALTLDCYISSTEAAYLSGELGEMGTFAEVVIAQANTLLDTVKVREIEIEAYTNQGEFAKALKSGLQFLQALGLELPEEPSDLAFSDFLTETQQQLADRSVTELLSLPAMASPTSQAMLRILVQLATPAYLGNPALYPLICFKQVQLSLTDGHIPASTFGYAVYGLLLSGVLGNISAGYEFGQLALQLLERFDSQEYTAKVLFHIAIFIEHWQKQACSTLPYLQKAYTIGLDTGDLAYAGYSAYVYVFHAYFIGKELTALERECQIYSSSLTNIKQNNALCYLQIFHQSIANLLGQSAHCGSLEGDLFNEQTTIKTLKQLNDQTGLWHFYTCKVSLNYLFHAYDDTLMYFHQAMSYQGGGIGMLSIPILWFYAALACSAQLADSPEQLDPAKADELWSLITEAKEKLENWATHAPMNCQHRYDLICAEEQQLLNHSQEALELYNRAIVGANENGYIQEAAIANELTAKLYLNLNKEKEAADYMQAAYYGYARWGAKAKIDDLEQCYPALLQPILQKTTEQLAFSPLETIATVYGPHLFMQTSSKTSGASTTGVNDALDFAAVLRASQALSGAIELEDLLCQLSQIILQNSGGDLCALILPDTDDIWALKALATPDSIDLCSEPLAHHPKLPLKLIQYVRNTQQTVVIDNLETELPVIDTYLQQSQPGSLLCLPFLNQGKLLGILYLHNRTTHSVFTQERIHLLKVLCTQAAISLENARLYKQEQNKTHALQTSLEELQQSEVRFRYLFEKSADAILLLKPEGFLSCNQASVDLFGYHHKEQLCNLHPSQISPEFQPDGQTSFDKANAMISRAIETGSHQFEWMHQRSNGETFWADVMLTPIPYQGGQVLHSIVRDISQRKAAEATILEKSNALEQALGALQNTQLKVVQSEKMASLGNLVAGVAHEVNNPIGFLNGSIKNAQAYLQELCEHIALYQQHHPQAAKPVQENAEDIDLDFLIEDFPKLLDSMSAANQRIKSISTSLRTFSRADTEHKVSANLHEGLDSTLLILKYRLKANENRPAIEVIKDYEEIPIVDCFPGQLNQVFMNLLANAIDIFDEAAEQSSFAELKEKPQIITVKTLLCPDQDGLEIRIGDNGKGMTEDVKARIFDHLFTTKDVGKGTGLGLAIAQQIIAEKHGGSLTVQSELGQGTEFCIRLPL